MKVYASPGLIVFITEQFNLPHQRFNLAWAIIVADDDVVLGHQHLQYCQYLSISWSIASS